MKIRLAVAIGAIIGALLRYGITSFSAQNEIWLTLIINLLGCLSLGFILIHGEQYLKGIPKFQPFWRPFLATGFLGGFTTTSAFAVHSIGLLQSGKLFEFTLLIILSILGGLMVFAFAQTLAVKRLAK